MLIGYWEIPKYFKSLHQSAAPFIEKGEELLDLLVPLQTMLDRMQHERELSEPHRSITYTASEDKLQQLSNEGCEPCRCVKCNPRMHRKFADRVLHWAGPDRVRIVQGDTSSRSGAARQV